MIRRATLRRLLAALDELTSATGVAVDPEDLRRAMTTPPPARAEEVPALNPHYATGRDLDADYRKRVAPAWAKSITDTPSLAVQLRGALNAARDAQLTTAGPAGGYKVVSVSFHSPEAARRFMALFRQANPGA
jgi:hypothetical protein